MAESSVYQFKIVLKDISPPVWRRIQVPGKYTFWELHCAIQDAFGWKDNHLHEFSMKKDTIGITQAKPVMMLGGAADDDEVLPGEKTMISAYFKETKDKGTYTYDFGDDWEHRIVLEAIMPKLDGEKYPTCVAGERQGLPEDCGSSRGYEELCKIMADPKHKEHKAKKEWLEKYIEFGKFAPEEFDAKKVKFADPGARWQSATERRFFYVDAGGKAIRKMFQRGGLSSFCK